MKKKLFWLGAIVLGLFAPHLAAAQNSPSWPVKAVRIVVPQSAGSTPDIICRLIADRLTESFGQTVFVENRPGAAGVVAAQAVARAEPDGYSLLFATSAVLSVNPHTLKSLPYDPLKDFEPVSLVARAPLMLFVRKDFPARSLADLIEMDKKKRGSVSIVTDGRRNISFMSMVWFNKLARTDFQLVPYSTIQQGIQDVIAGRVDLVLTGVAAVKGLLESGELRPIAVTSTERLEGFESVPSISEQFPNFNVLGWFAIAAPKGTPPAVVSKLNEEVAKIVQTPAVVNRLAVIGFSPAKSLSPKRVSEFVESEHKNWGVLTREIGIEPE